MAETTKKIVLTFDQFFAKKFVTDPNYSLNVIRQYVGDVEEFRNRGDATAEYIRDYLIKRHLMPWLNSSEENEELARKVLGHEIINLLRPC